MLKLLEYLLALETKRTWNTGTLQKECEQWLGFLVDLVDVTDTTAKNCFRQILYCRSSEFFEKNEQVVSEKVS